jgi:alanine racemase
VPNYPLAYIDLDALTYNLSKVKQFAPNSKVFAVIKANAYGHGAIEAAKALSEADAFAVARVDEAIELREAGISKTIILLEGIRSADELLLASQYNLSPVFHSEYQLDFLATIDIQQPLSNCWLMLETGMHRLGIKPQLASDYTAKLKSTNKVNGDIGLMSHFANSDSLNDSRNNDQLKQIANIEIDTSVSMANSGAIIAIPESHADWIRPGIMLYGSSPFAEKSAAELGLKPVMKLVAKVTAVQQIKVGDQVGYGGDFIAEQEMSIATVSVGYGDGYHRSLAKTGYVEINGQLAKVVGRVSMDMICVDVTDSDVQVGEQVVLWGSELLSVDTVATWADTISYELLCHVTSRVTRIYG